jgi:hypothetical protein
LHRENQRAVRGETLSRRRQREARNGETARGERRGERRDALQKDGERRERRGQRVPAASRCEVAAMVVVAVGGHWGVVGAATEMGGEEMETTSLKNVRTELIDLG